MFEDFFPYKYSILNFTEIKRAQRDLSIPVKIKTFRLQLKELLMIKFFTLLEGGGDKLTH
jgi:hypothetical protein